MSTTTEEGSVTTTDPGGSSDPTTTSTSTEGATSPLPTTTSTSTEGATSPLPTTTAGPTTTTAEPTDAPLDSVCGRELREVLQSSPLVERVLYNTQKYVAHVTSINAAVKNQGAYRPIDADDLPIRDGVIGWQGADPLSIHPLAGQVAGLMSAVTDLRYIGGSNNIVKLCGHNIPFFQLTATEELENFAKSLETFDAVALYVNQSGNNYLVDKFDGIYEAKISPAASELIFQRADLRDITGERVVSLVQKPHPSLFACDAGNVYRYDYVEEDPEVDSSLWNTWIESVVFEAPLMLEQLLPAGSPDYNSDTNYPYQSEIIAVEWSSLGMLAVTLEWTRDSSESRHSVTWFIHPVTGSICAGLTDILGPSSWNRPYVITQKFVKKLVDGGTFTSELVNDDLDSEIVKQTFLGIISREDYAPTEPGGYVETPSWDLEYPPQEDVLYSPTLVENPPGTYIFNKPNAQATTTAYKREGGEIVPAGTSPSILVTAIGWCPGNALAANGDELPILIRGRAELAASGGPALSASLDALYWVAKPDRLDYSGTPREGVTNEEYEFLNSPLRYWLPTGSLSNNSFASESAKKYDVAIDRLGRIIVVANDQSFAYQRVKTYPYYDPELASIGYLSQGEVVVSISSDTVNGPKIRRIDVPPNADLFGSEFISESDGSSSTPLPPGPQVTCNTSGGFAGFGTGLVGSSDAFMFSNQYEFDAPGYSSQSQSGCMAANAEYLILGTAHVVATNTEPSGGVVPDMPYLEFVWSAQSVVGMSFVTQLSEVSKIKMTPLNVNGTNGHTRTEAATTQIVGRFQTSAVPSNDLIALSVIEPSGTNMTSWTAKSQAMCLRIDNRDEGDAYYYVDSQTLTTTYANVSTPLIGSEVVTETDEENWVVVVEFTPTTPSGATTPVGPDGQHWQVTCEARLVDGSDTAIAEIPSQSITYSPRYPITGQRETIMFHSVVQRTTGQFTAPNFRVQVRKAMPGWSADVPVTCRVMAFRPMLWNISAYDRQAGVAPVQAYVLPEPTSGVCPAFGIVYVNSSDTRDSAVIAITPVTTPPTLTHSSNYRTSEIETALLPTGEGKFQGPLSDYCAAFGLGEQLRSKADSTPWVGTKKFYIGSSSSAVASRHIYMAPQPNTVFPTTTTGAPASTTTASPGESWSYGWVYLACSDGIRSYRELSQIAFIAHSDCTGITCADGPAVYFCTGNGEIYYCPPNLASKLRIFQDSSLKFTDLAFDHVSKRLIAQHGEFDLSGRPTEGRLLSMKLDGTDVKRLVDNRNNLKTSVFGADLLSRYVGPLGAIDVDADHLLYHAANWTSDIVHVEIRLESHRRPGETQNLLDTFPALIDTTDVIDVDSIGSYNLDVDRRPSAIYPNNPVAQWPLTNFATRPSILLETVPAPTTTSAPTTTTGAPTTTTTGGPTTTTTIGPTTTTSTGPTTTTSTGPTTTTAVPTTTTTLPPIDPGDTECWQSEGDVTLYPTPQYAELVADPDIPSQLYQLIETELTPGMAIRLKVRVLILETPMTMFLKDGDTGATLSTRLVEATGNFELLGTVPASGLITFGFRISSNASPLKVRIDRPDVRVCSSESGFSPLTDAVPSAGIEGYLTIGDISRLLDGQTSLADCLGSGELPDLLIEPGRVFLATGRAIKQINVYNEKRTHLVTDADCKAVQYEADVPQYIRAYSGSPDAVRLAGGHQTTVQQNQVSGDVNITSIVNGGELGPPLGELPMYEGEAPPEDRDYLDGGLACSGVLRSINGVAGPNLQLLAGLGVLVAADNSLSRIIINVNGEGISSCPQFSEPIQVACPPPRALACGPAEGDDPCPGVPDNRSGYLEGTSASTTTRPPNPSIDLGNTLYDVLPPTGTCTYKRIGAAWVLQGEPTIPDWCECKTPNFSGYENQVVRVTAQPVPADSITKLRNVYFLLTPALKFWTLTGGSVVTEDEDRDPEELPYVSMSTGGKLVQTNLPLSAGQYRVQIIIDAAAPTSFRVRVASATNSGAYFLDNHTVPAGRTTYVSDLFTFPGGQLQFELTANGAMFVYAPVLV